MKLRVIHIWSNRGRTVSISQKLVVMPKNIQSQHSKTTFQQNLTCIFLPVRAILKYPLCNGGPCNRIFQEFRLGILEEFRLEKSVDLEIRWLWNSFTILPGLIKNSTTVYFSDKVLWGEILQNTLIIYLFFQKDDITIRFMLSQS